MINTCFYSILKIWLQKYDFFYSVNHLGKIFKLLPLIKAEKAGWKNDKTTHEFGWKNDKNNPVLGWKNDKKSII